MKKIKRRNMLIICGICCLLWYFINVWKGTMEKAKKRTRAIWQPSNSSQYDLFTSEGIPKYEFRQRELSDLLETSCDFSVPVPNIVHYVLLGKKEIYIYEYISIISANSFLKPCFILIHGDMLPTGKWWDKLLLNVTNIVHVYREAPTSIFGHPINIVEHKTDVMRLEAIKEYGGIYLDTDMYVLRSFDPLRVYNLTLGVAVKGAMANGVIVSPKNAPFLQIWHLSYHGFNDSQWADNSLFFPYKLWKQFPNLLHVEKDSLINIRSLMALGNANVKWDPRRYSVHVYARYLPKRSYEIEELEELNTTFGALSRLILFGNQSLVVR